MIESTQWLDIDQNIFFTEEGLKDALEHHNELLVAGYDLINASDEDEFDDNSDTSRKVRRFLYKKILKIINLLPKLNQNLVIQK